MYYMSTFILQKVLPGVIKARVNKKMVSFRLSPELQARIARVAKATRLKKTAIIEMCVEMHLPLVEQKYAHDLEEYDKKHPAEVTSLEKRGFFAQHPAGETSSTKLGVPPGTIVKVKAEKFPSKTETPHRK
jgi:predicted DNA-binding protein